MEAAFRALVSGQRRGPVAMLLRAGLRVAEVPYALAVAWRNRRYDRGQGVEHVDAPVICVGNLTLGGTGKTPLVEWLARQLRARQLRVALVSRGYGAAAGEPNDEALELEQRLPDVPHVQDADRVAGARLAIEEFESQVVLLDDGFQHRRLGRDLDIVLVDATEPFGYGHLLPRGMLREPLTSLARADVVILTRADLVAPATLAQLRQRLATLAPEATLAEVGYAPRRLLAASGQTATLDELRRGPLLAFAGIGNPQGFRTTLQRCGAEIVALHAFADHHRYTRDDIESLARSVRESACEAVVCTHKDLVKIGLDRLGGKPLWALSIEAEFLDGEAELLEQLEAILPVTEW